MLLESWKTPVRGSKVYVVLRVYYQLRHWRRWG